MTHFLKDQMKCKGDPSYYFLFSNGERQNFRKNKDFLPNTILNFE